MLKEVLEFIILFINLQFIVIINRSLLYLFLFRHVVNRILFRNHLYRLYRIESMTLSKTLVIYYKL